MNNLQVNTGDGTKRPTPHSPSTPTTFGLPPPSPTQFQPINQRQSLTRRHSRKRSSTIFVAPRQVPVQNTEQNINPVLVQGATTLAFAQLLSKLLAFLLNQLLIKFLNARDLGAASQLDLLLSTSLSLSRDFLRLASQRQSLQSRQSVVKEYTTDGRAVLNTQLGLFQETVNIGWLAILLGIVLLMPSASLLYSGGLWPKPAIAITCLAAIVELLVEPVYLLMQLKLEFTLRAKAESIAHVLRVCVVACLIVFKKSPYVAFAVGHLSYALALMLVYLRRGASQAFENGYSLLPTKVWTSQLQDSQVYIGEKAWKTSFELGAQQVVKYFLTEGDKLAVGVMTTLEEQGEYALAANYGSMLARLVFLPVEDALRGYFTQVLPQTKKTTTQDDKDQQTHSRTFSSSSESDADSSSTEEGLEILTRVLRAYTYLGILAAGFGPLVSDYLISFLVGRKQFGNAGQVLSAYACYLPILAYNGSLDALVQSVGSLKVLRQQGFVLASLAVLFVALTYVFTSLLRMGAVGLVWAQLVGMSLRTLWSLKFSIEYFGRGHSWLRMCCPPWYVTLVSSLSVFAARVFVGKATNLHQFTIISLLAVFVLSLGGFAEQQTVMTLVQKFMKRAKIE